MSWAAHEFESYVLQKHFRTRAAFSGVLLGCLLPDLFTKLPVYGVHVGAFSITKATEPWLYHRGWPGVGPTHSFVFVAVMAVVALPIFRSREWALGLLVGGWAHVLTDCFDSVGTMLFYPFTTDHYSFGMWRYAAQEGRYGDASAYYSSLGGAWDLLWLAICLLNVRVFSRRHFMESVAPHDPLWSFLQRKFRLRATTLLALYRAYFVYGASRVIGWTTWARLVNPDRSTQVPDVAWGGPGWVEAAPRFQRADSWQSFAAHTLVGAAGTCLALWVLWRLVASPLWRRARLGAPAVLDDIYAVDAAVSTSTTTGQ